MKLRNESANCNLEICQSLMMDGHNPRSSGSDDRFTFCFQLNLNHPLPTLISAASITTDASSILYDDAILF